jgi:hypothetical protein
MLSRNIFIVLFCGGLANHRMALAAGGDGGGAIRERADACERLEKLALDKVYKAGDIEHARGWC